MLYFHHPSSLEHDPRVLFPLHPDSPDRIEALEAALDEAGWPGCKQVQAPSAERSELELVHTPTYVDLVRQLCLRGGGQLDGDTFVTKSSYEAALHAAGGACAMVRELVAGGGTGFCAPRPAGHHALPDMAMGFCLFNNIAIAAELAIRKLGLRKVFILDWDVHHGNGTEHFFRQRPDVLFASIHQGGDMYPGSGPLSYAGAGDGLGYTINVPVYRGAGEEVWLPVLEHIIIPAALEFDPQLILISAGFDGHRDDPLADCTLQAESYARMTSHVMQLAASVDAPIGMVLEGGYTPSVLADSVLATIGALIGHTQAESIAPDPIVTSRAAAAPSSADALSAVGGRRVDELGCPAERGSSSGRVRGRSRVSWPVPAVV